MNVLLKAVCAAASAGLLLTGLAACGGAAGTDEDTITLGVLGPISGVQAEIGRNQVAAAEVAAAQINAAGGIGGKKVTLVERDEGESPDIAASAVRKLAGDGVHLQLGMLSSANCLATSPILPRLGVIMVASGCTNDALTGMDGGKAPYDNFFRVGTNDTALVTSLSSFIAGAFPGVTDYDAFGYDYVTGTTQWALYQKTLRSEGVPIRTGRQTFVPLGEQNFKQYVQAMASAPGDRGKRALYLGTYGSGTGSFLQQAQDLGLAKRYALIVQPGGYYPVARTMGGRAPEVWNAYDYSYAAYDNAMNGRFVANFRRKTGKMPISWSYDAYLAVYAYKAAIEKAGTTEYEKVLAALPGVRFDSPAGPLTINATTHQANTPVVVTKSVGDANATEDVRILQTHVVRPKDRP
jgi:branched-chain amino acid transport system substrate-binding protein